jgi:hypothetical protein
MKSRIGASVFAAAAMIFLAATANAQRIDGHHAAMTVKAILPADFRTDNCTFFPDGNYADCCVAHDLEYYAGGSWKLRLKSDNRLFKCVAAKPQFYNKIVAPVMWLGVRAGGVGWLRTRFSWGFGQRGKKKTPVPAGK